MRGLRLIPLLLILLPALARARSGPPNIIVILSDDMGYSDLGCYGGEIHTPNLDALAAGGVRCTQFYNGARCCPTRASLLTGLHPHQAGIGHMTDDRGHDGYRGVLNNRCLTIAEALRPAGYRTLMCGKWHVTRFDRANSDQASWPVQRGFEKFYGTITGAGSFYDPTTLCRQNRWITPQNDPEYRPSEFYYTNAITDNAVRFLRQHREASPDRPFFLYLAYTAAHWPMHALEKDILKYKGRYDGGYEAIRKERFARMKSMGLIAADAVLPPAAENWNDVKNKAWEARCMEVYAAMVDCMDQGIGRVMAELKASGQFENTLILYLQDNGGCAEGMGRTAGGPAPADLKPMAPDQLQTQIWPPMQTRDGRHVRTGPGVMPGPADTYIGYGRGWANVSNTPFREYKHWTHEGGISTPLIAHWPAGLDGSPTGRTVSEPGQLPDIMATCLDAAGAAYPDTSGGSGLKPLQGRSLLPFFRNPANPPLQRELFWEHEGNRAVRDGKWKLVAMADQPWELYDLDADRSESRNLAAAERDRVRTMAAAWESWAARSDVLPLGTWKTKASAAATGKSGASSRRHFELKPGDKLTRSMAPDVAGRGFSITAKLEAATSPAAGVIVAQGGSANGYSLWIENGSAHFGVRSRQSLTKISAPLGSGPVTLVAKLSDRGELSLTTGAPGPVTGSAGGPVAAAPVDGLEVGADEGGTAGDYTGPFRFNGTITSVIIDLDDASPPGKARTE